MKMNRKGIIAVCGLFVLAVLLAFPGETLGLLTAGGESSGPTNTCEDRKLNGVFTGVALMFTTNDVILLVPVEYCRQFMSTRSPSARFSSKMVNDFIDEQYGRTNYGKLMLKRAEENQCAVPAPGCSLDAGIDQINPPVEHYNNLCCGIVHRGVRQSGNWTEGGEWSCGGSC